ncbi:MAG TPA: gamma-glutamyl-gamma-aminobutyrate hydrolase family protein [Terriglobia bacterium]|nr:gamma-glutamyl-gamma-aminobutyrate hydrolase family protein [Terriglobia bacterium]
MKIAISVSSKEKAKGEKSPYVRALCDAGLAPKEIVLLSPADRARAKVENLDGVVFAGGEDVAPELYDERKKYSTVKSDRARDDFELTLFDAAREERIPILGVCRGMQLINVRYGGTLYQDLKLEPPADPGPTVEHKQSGSRQEATHSVTLTEPESHLGAAFQGSCRVNSLHHQAVRRVGHGLKVIAYSEDGLPEAVEDAGDYPYLMAVQWHPEEMTDRPEQKKIFEQFLSKCREAGERRTHAARTS